MAAQSASGAPTVTSVAVAASVPALELIDVHKSYGRTRALRGVSMAFAPGAVHGVAGHNGAGKSTLVRTIGGLERPDSGRLEVDGTEVEFRSPADSLAHDISIIQQTPQICESLTVAENIWLARQPRGSWAGISWRSMRAAAAEQLDALGLSIDPRSTMESLSMAERQLVEIARAMSRSSRVLVMDEPTTALSAKEVDRLFAVACELRDQGVALVLIDHKLDEVMAVCDEVSVLRDGSKVAHELVASTSTDRLADHIVGHRHEKDVLVDPAVALPTGTPRIAVTGLSRAPLYEDVTFMVRPGEVVGVAGLVGSGRSRMAKAIAGIEPAVTGTVEVDGKPVRIRSVADAHRLGIAYVPEDRASYGVLPDMSIEANISLGSLGRLTRRSMLSHEREHALAEEYVTRMGVRCAGVHQRVGELSGGNQQKVLLARWLAFGPSLLILDEPTQGIDIGVKLEIHRLVRELAADGLALVVVSSEFDELVDVCDRILVMRQGRIVSEHRGGAVTAGELVRWVSAEAGTEEVAS